MVYYLANNPRDDANEFLKFANEEHDSEFRIFGARSFPEYYGHDPGCVGTFRKSFGCVLPTQAETNGFSV
jgi:hypothetical protein